MDFEFDPQKSESNKVKHGIDFVEAQEIWKDNNSYEMPLETSTEPRYMQVGMIAGKHWSAIITYRGEKIRIISVRRARKEEVAIYYEEKNNG